MLKLYHVRKVMADTSAASEATTTPALVGGTKKSKMAASKKPRTKPAHPKTSEMVANAIKSLKERGGSSLQAIKKYIAANYKVEAEKSAPFIKRYLKSAVLAGELVQTKGKGASGSFKLAGTAGATEKTAVKRPHVASKPRDKKAAKKAVGVKAATGRKSAASAATKKVAAAKKAAAPKPKKAPSKAKKAAKSPTKKPKAPRPKKATPSKAKASPKKRK